MECFVVFLILVLAAVLATGFGLGRASHGPNQAYAALTKRFGGAYHGGSLLRRPAVRFRYGHTWVTISPGSETGPAGTTQARIQWPHTETTLRVDTAASKRGETAEALTLCIGDEDFDQTYRVQGDTQEDAKRLLSEGVRWQLDRLRQSFDCPLLSLSINHGRLIVEKPLLFRRGDDLEQFTQYCLELFDQAMLACCEGIEFMDSSGEAQLIERPVCQVCGEEIESDMVFCRRCRTPHHLDCWQYTGCCSTYGCRETRYIVPELGRPVRSRQEEDNTQ